MKQYEATIHASASETTTTNSGDFVTSPQVRDVQAEALGLLDVVGKDVRFNLDVTAQSGTTPTLDVTIEGKVGGVYVQIGAFTQVGAATGSESIVITNVPQTIRAVYTLGGTSPDYTFSLTMVR